jgi:hypothetical protein
VLYGLVHLWCVALAQRLVPSGPDYGRTGASWAFTDLLGHTPTRMPESVLFALAAAVFVASGVGVAAHQE